ncbi:helix-turn-helix domain-containing protein [Eubacterium sp.]|uniref:helix-turn-helix domain-containing protein n=1 Tax=Eubacterium sp. TaxID=142586 RepID=UPI003FA53C01
MTKLRELNLISVSEASELLNLCPDSVYRLCRKDCDFPAVQLGKKWYIVADQLPNYINEKLERKKS